MTTPLWKFLTFTQNFHLYESAFANAWSLCVEEQFYLILPLVSLWFFYKGQARTVMVTISILLGFEIILRACIWQHYSNNGQIELNTYFAQIYYPTYTRISPLLLGLSIALIKNFRPILWQKLLTKGNHFLFAGLACIAIAFYCFRHVVFILHYYPTVYAYPVLCLGFALLVFAALCPSSYLYKIHIPGVKTLAILSYAMYLIQKPVIHATNLIMLDHGYVSANLLSILTSFLFTLIASAVIYQVIERPFLMLRDRKI